MALVAARLGTGFVPTEAIFASGRSSPLRRRSRCPAPCGWSAVRRTPVCCGGLRPLAPGVAELKRMFVTAPARRNRSRALLRSLEQAAVDGGARRLRLITTEALVEARALYAGSGYAIDVRVERDGDRNDLWMEKALAPAPARGVSGVMERDPATNPPPPAPTPRTPRRPARTAPRRRRRPWGVDEDVKPVEERLKDVERDRS